MVRQSKDAFPSPITAAVAVCLAAVVRVLLVSVPGSLAQVPIPRGGASFQRLRDTLRHSKSWRIAALSSA